MFKLWSPTLYSWCGYIFSTIASCLIFHVFVGCGAGELEAVCVNHWVALSHYTDAIGSGGLISPDRRSLTAIDSFMKVRKEEQHSFECMEMSLEVSLRIDDSIIYVLFLYT